MDGVTRRESAYNRRVAAAQLARDRPHEPHHSNGEEGLYRLRRPGRPASYTANFTKGLAHASDGSIASPDDYIDFIRAVDSGREEDIRRIPLGPSRTTKGGLPRWRSRIACRPTHAPVRAWESMGAGLTFSLMGPDAQSVSMPPAPRLDSCEMASEMGELYLMALLRDVPFAAWGSGDSLHPAVANAVKQLNELHWFNGHNGCLSLTQSEKGRKRRRVRASNVFRGITPGVQNGPYISQFLLIGSRHLNERDAGAARQRGRIRYGAASIDQRVPVATRRKDYMTKFGAFLDVQDGADLRGRETYEEGERFIATPRDLCTYVHYDALYQAYLNACIVLLNTGAPLDPGMPFQRPDSVDKQQGFATFGGPHILSLVCEVSTRALKAVRFQKFNVHRRLRPEAVGGLLDYHLRAQRRGKKAFPEVAAMAVGLKDILDKVEVHNAEQNASSSGSKSRSKDSKSKSSSSSSKSKSGSSSSSRRESGSFLLPMAYPEGSPMHPSYGAGHAAVAGACVTILKAYFDSHHRIEVAYEATEDGSALREVETRASLTVGTELNKLAENVAIGRGWAGVHYFSDYIESMRLGEKVAIGMLEEQKLLFGENFYMSLEMFNGETLRI